ncbi:hypothetical protein [Pseudarthrobacter sp. LT1]|uniref:hypothetical protein n=1 Tax=Pseudarthrobacter sp. LT1 TaxID=3111450 RepID=UPI002D77256F|nr:hypothetical protein [Pseudarthrobacter sp. LT1]WRT14636.1 hypothetical protein VIK36_03850 [Pseudarthrobacter sp. LT1]
MDDLIDEIDRAVRAELWMLALAGALALPDICAAVQSPNGKTTGSKYKRWVMDYLLGAYPKLDPDELHQMRCSLLHQGTSSAIKYKRVCFVSPRSGLIIHNSVINDALILDMPMFCRDVIAAVERWRLSVQHTEAYRKNIEHVMRWHRGGVGDYFLGGEVLT